MAMCKCVVTYMYMYVLTLVTVLAFYCGYTLGAVTSHGGSDVMVTMDTGMHDDVTRVRRDTGVIDFTCPGLPERLQGPCRCVPAWGGEGATGTIACLSAGLYNLSILNALKDKSSVRYLRVERDNLTRLSPDNLPDFPNLESIDVQKSFILHIEPGVLDKYRMLKRVDLSWNRFVPAPRQNMINLLNLFNSIRKLNVSRLFLVKISNFHAFDPKDLSGALKLLENMTSLEYFAFAYNPISDFADNLFSPLRNLRYLDLRAVTKTTVITKVNIKAFRHLTRLDTLQLQLNDLKNFSVWVDDDNSPILPSLTSLYMDFNIFDSLPPSLFRGLEGLRRLTLDGNCAGPSELFADNFAALRHLRELSMANNQFQKMNASAFNLDTLETLDLTNSKFTFYEMPPDFLQKTPNLRVLKLNSLSTLQHGSKVLNRVLSGLTKLEFVELQSLNLHELDPDMFRNLTSLQHVNLAHNKIRTLPVDIFRDNYNLQELMLGNNRLVNINPTSFPTEALSNLSMLDISNNPLVCDCGMSWFRNTWMETPWGRGRMKDKLNLDRDANDTACESPESVHGSSLDLFHINRERCLYRNLPIGFHISLLISFIIAGASCIFACGFRFQWHFKYWCFNLKARYWEMAPVDEEGRQYKFDVFVSYCSADLKWVKQFLLPFERKHGLTFCLHERDWIPGWEITDNIIKSIEESRKIILVVSNAFARSQWCHFEMSMIQVKLLQEDRDNVILLIKESVHDYNMTPRLAWHMKSKTYLKWPYADYTDVHVLQRHESNAAARYELQRSTDFDSVSSMQNQSFDQLLSGEYGSGGAPVYRNDKGEQLFWRQLQLAVANPARSHLFAPVDD